MSDFKSQPVSEMLRSLRVSPPPARGTSDFRASLRQGLEAAAKDRTTPVPLLPADFEGGRVVTLRWPRTLEMLAVAAAVALLVGGALLSNWNFAGTSPSPEALVAVPLPVELPAESPPIVEPAPVKRALVRPASEANDSPAPEPDAPETPVLERRVLSFDDVVKRSPQPKIRPQPSPSIVPLGRQVPDNDAVIQPERDARQLPRLRIERHDLDHDAKRSAVSHREPVPGPAEHKVSEPATRRPKIEKLDRRPAPVTEEQAKRPEQAAAVKLAEARRRLQELRGRQEAQRVRLQEERRSRRSERRSQPVRERAPLRRQP